MSSIPPTSGVYCITCIPTDRIYVGSAVNLRRRWSQHRYELRNKRHHTHPLQNAWNKYGEQSFTFDVLELTIPTFEIEREQYWLDKLKPFGKRGFNINPKADKPFVSPEGWERFKLARTGHAVSEETRAKISASKTGHRPDPTVYDARRKTIIVIAPDGVEYTVHGVGKFCKEHNLDISSLMRTAKGFDRGTACSQHKGWKARFPD